MLLRPLDVFGKGIDQIEVERSLGVPRELAVFEATPLPDR